jgi:biopolymer transport protein ExbD
MKLPPDTSDADGPNLTPVIDIVFLLLIFFLVAARYDKEEQERELEIELPQVAAGQPLAMTGDLVVNITSDGRYRVVGKELNEQQLSQAIKTAKTRNPHRSVLIASDKESPIKHTAFVKGICYQQKMKSRVAALE